VVDASQGVEAQTVANSTRHRFGSRVISGAEQDRLAPADPDRVAEEIEDMSLDASERCAPRPRPHRIGRFWKCGEAGAPPGAISMRAEALIIDSWFDNYVAC